MLKNNLYSRWLGALVACLAFVSFSASAQESSINAFSPFSMYGIGEIKSQGTLPQRSMGGAGVALRSLSTINLLNPASYSAALPRSVLFNFGLEGQNFYNSQMQADGTMKKTSYCTFNFHDIALQIPLTKRLGLGLSLAPYSSVGYRMYDRETIADVGLAEYDYSGEGDVTEVKVGLGWEPFKNFSIGAAAIYYWGDIDRNYRMTLIPYTGTGTYPSTIGLSNYSISHFAAQFGVQYTPIMNKKRVLSLGLVYDLGGDLNPMVTNTIKVNGTINSEAVNRVENLPLVLPHKLSAGAFYETQKFAVAVDAVYERWGSSNTTAETASGDFRVAYCDTGIIKAGVEWTPNRNDVRNFLKRWHYRLGFNYGYYHQTFGGERVPQYALTLGFGIPVKFGGFSSVDVGFEYGCRGKDQLITEQVSMLKQQYFKFAIAFSLFGEDYWFVRPKYD